MVSNPAVDKHLKTWEGLNKTLQKASEQTCEVLLDREKEHKRRKQFLLRIHSRLNKVRAERERKELMRLVR